TAALGSPEDREALAADLLRLYTETPTRVPPAERYETDSGRQTGTPARPVLGAVFAPVLAAERDDR
ncbi:MAG: glutaminase domain-containing protein, partial [Planctomycetota bacterium]